MSTQSDHLDSLRQYTEASERAADQIIRAYSTSFGAATRLLGERHRQHVRNLYALVRVADELVDGVAAAARLTPEEQLQNLDSLERETLAAVQCGYSSNAIVHAFASSARTSAIDSSLIVPFFVSMRMDLRPPTEPDQSNIAGQQAMVHFDKTAHADYVYGSAEVVGLMCLRIFLRESSPSTAELESLELSARALGAAFQNVNFLRDLADDTHRLSRNYLSDGSEMTEALKLQWISTIREQLDVAEQALPLLPPDARTGVDCARRLFASLADKLELASVEELRNNRVRVSNPAKAMLVFRSLAATRRARFK